MVRFTNAKHSNTPPKINKKGAKLTFVGIKRRTSKFKSQLGRHIVNFQRHLCFPGVADEYWEPVNLALSAREGSWVFKMADRMEQNETGTTEGPTEEFLPGIGELKTFSQVRRQGVSKDLVFDTSCPLVEWIKMCPAPVRKPVHLPVFRSACFFS